MWVLQIHTFILSFCCCTLITGGAASSKCEMGWENFGPKCYKLIYPSEPGASTVLRKLCNQRFGEKVHAVQISSQEENDWVVDFAKKTMKADGKYEAPKNAWILTGGMKPEGGELSWDKDGAMDGNMCPMNYTNWAPEEPNGKGLSIDIYLDDSVPPPSHRHWKNNYFGKWDDYAPERNDSTHPIVCETNAMDSKFDPGTCSYVEDCVNIKRSTLMTILESCACSA